MVTCSISLADGPAAARAYLEHAQPHLQPRYPGVDLAQSQVTYLDAGIMNYVYRVAAPGGTFYLKQALDRVKQHDRIGPDLAGVSPARIRVEERALSWLAKALPGRIAGRVPRVAWYDAENNVLWTEELAADGGSLQGALERGEWDEGLAEALGELLGAVHAARFGEVPPLWGSEAEDRENWERFLRMRTLGVLPRADLPPAGEAAVRSLHEDGHRRARWGMLSHLDAAPKNVLVGKDGSASLLDFELGAAVSDPAYDPGFLTGHYLLMGECRPAEAAAAARAAGAVVKGYLNTGPPLDRDWLRRVARYAAVTMLYRLFGSSPAPCIPRDRFTAVRERAGEWLTREAL